jgi:hypothetical protein
VLPDLFLFIRVRPPVDVRRHHLLDLDSGFCSLSEQQICSFLFYLFFYFYFRGALIWRCQIWFATLFCIALRFLLIFSSLIFSPFALFIPTTVHMLGCPSVSPLLVWHWGRFLAWMNLKLTRILPCSVL